MPAKNEDLHGFVPDNSDVVLILIDVINDFDFPEGAMLYEHALPMAERIAQLKQRAHEANIPVVYVNDNFGRWQSDFHKLIDHVRDNDERGRRIVELLNPGADDYFVLKPKHSAFFSTTLDTLLQYLGAKTLILTGVAGNICVLFTANDAYLRDFNIVVPRDCIASNLPEENEHALHLMQTVLKADTRPSTEISFSRLRQEADDSGEESPNPQQQLAELQ